MPKYHGRLRIQGRYHYATSTDMLALLGVKRLPPAGMTERLIQGVRVYVKPQAPLSPGQRHRATHRVIAICTCGRHIPVGRLHQHKCKP